MAAAGTSNSSRREAWAYEKLVPVLEPLVVDCLKEMPEDPKVYMSKWMADRKAGKLPAPATEDAEELQEIRRVTRKSLTEAFAPPSRVSSAPVLTGVIDTHIHLSNHYSGGLSNAWHPEEAEGFRRDWTEENYRASIARGSFQVEHAVFVECFNLPAVEEAKWVLGLAEDPNSIVCAVVSQIVAQDGAKAVEDALALLRLPDGSLPRALKGARFVFPARGDKNTPDACLDPVFHEGLDALQKAGLHWEFCCNPFMAPNLATCIRKFPQMTFVVNHGAHNGNNGGEMEKWGPAIDELATLPNVYMKTGAVEEWGVPDPAAYMERLVNAFPFDRLLYESNWFVNEAMGDSYDRTARLLHEACLKKGASDADLQNVFANNARRAYRLDV